jgi:hypothetical protein
LEGKAGVLGKNPPQFHFIYQKSPAVGLRINMRRLAIKSKYIELFLLFQARLYM